MEQKQSDAQWIANLKQHLKTFQEDAKKEMKRDQSGPSIPGSDRPKKTEKKDKKQDKKRAKKREKSSSSDEEGLSFHMNIAVY